MSLASLDARHGKRHIRRMIMVRTSQQQKRRSLAAFARADQA
jgi:hypothetical protein